MDHHKRTSIAGNLANDKRLKWGLYPAKQRVVPEPQLFRCLARTNHLVRASPWLPREEQFLEMQGWGRGGCAESAAGGSSSFQNQQAMLKREMGLSSTLFLGEGEKLPVPPAVSKALGWHSEGRVCSVGLQVPAGGGTSSLGGAEKGRRREQGSREGEGIVPCPSPMPKKWKETINPLFSEYKKVVKIGLQGLCKWLC